MKSDKNKSRTTTLHNIRKILQTETDIGPATFRMEIKQFANDI